MVFVKNGLITKRLENFELHESETICLELTISGKKWFLAFAYRPPKEENKKSFFKDLTNMLDNAMKKYENIFICGDFNIDTNNKSKDKNDYLSDFIDTFSLRNLINSKTCFKSTCGTSLDIMLTNRPNYFQKSCTIETGLSDCHKMIATCLKATFRKIPAKVITYRDYKNFQSDIFLYELDQEMIKGRFYKDDNPYQCFTNSFKSILDKHAPFKKKKVRGNNSPFMTKELRKAFMDRSRIINRYRKWPSRTNF